VNGATWEPKTETAEIGGPASDLDTMVGLDVRAPPHGGGV
jgi:hypothetical protein